VFFVSAQVHQPPAARLPRQCVRRNMRLGCRDGE
jgi:hypothetical protein